MGKQSIPISLKLLAGMVPVIMLFALALYVFSVPLIHRTVFDLEEHAGRAVLDTVFELANRIHLNLENFRALALESHKTRLKDVMDIVSGYVESVEAEMQTGLRSPAEARAALYATLKTFEYGNRDYLWVADYHGRVLSHPDPEVEGQFIDENLDEYSQDFVARMVAIARTQGEGYHEYRWRRLGEQQSRPKISYFKDFPRWQFVVGSGVYLDDVERDVERRKAMEIRDLRQALRDIRINRTGYLYIFDSAYRMVIHPNPNIEGSFFGELVDPVSRRPIGAELVQVADTQEGRFYKWDRPDDPGNYIYDKISWVRHFEGFDWYIASSVYVSELQEGAQTLGQRILLLSFSFLLLASLLSYAFVRRITRPIRSMAATAMRVEQGDLSASSGIQRADEIGVLSRAFDAMVVRLRDNIDNLDGRVRDKTDELQQANRRLLQTIARLERVQRDLTLAEERQRVILDAIPAYVAQLDEHQSIQFVNRRYAYLLGSDQFTLLGQSLPRRADWASDSGIMEKLSQAQLGENVSFLSQARTPSGHELLLKTNLIPESNPNLGGVFVLTLDVTEEKLAEKRLLEMQKMNAVAQLAAGLAHDFNNLLAIILGNLSGAEEHLGHQEALQEYLQPALRATRRGAEIMTRLLAFARSQPLQPIAVDCWQLLNASISLLERSMPANIHVQTQADDTDCWAFVDPGQLENAIVNLALNARDAMPDGGSLRLSVSRQQIAEQQSPDLTPGNYVQIQLIDSGHGFSPQALERAFEPFFTTKKSGAGSGLGLSMVFGFVQQSHGHLEIHSREGQGATVRLLLPLASDEQRAVSVASPSSAVAAAQWAAKLALVVEDQQAVRDTVRRQLVELGFSVIEAGNADEAMALLPHLEALYLLLSDVVMPGELDGFALAEQAQQIHPGLHTLLMTGFASEELLARNQQRWTVLRKPFDKLALCQAIGQVTEAGPLERGDDAQQAGICDRG